MIVQNAAHHIAPLGIRIDTLDILLRRAGIPHQQNIFEVVALFTKILQKRTDQRASQRSQDNIDAVEHGHHGTGEMDLRDHVPAGHHQYHAHRVRLENIQNFITVNRGPLWRV